MRYLALLYGEEDAAYDPSSQAFQEEVARYERFAEFAGDAIVGGEALEPVASARTIRPAADLVTDGPFIEGTEVIGGFLVLEAADLDEAMDLARQIPAASDGAVELRPLVEWFHDAGRTPPPEADRYVALLYDPPSDADVPGTAAWEEGVHAHTRFGELVGNRILAGAALHPADTATTLRVLAEEVIVSDGPFAETVEVIGGLYSFWTLSTQEAVDFARTIPVGPDGAVELRPVQELGA